MKTALLVCDHIADKFRPIAGGYEDMYPALLPGLDLTPFWVCDGHFPDSVADFDAYLCSGSRASVYDDHEWVHRLKAFVAAVHAAGKRFVGICFGHQMLAEALGGKVLPAATGWCVGAHAFEITTREPWMEPFASPVFLPMLCQDQIQKLPAGSVVLASAAGCAVGIFRVGETMLGIQAHPEFAKEYLLAVLDDRVDRIGTKKTATARASLQQDLHNRLLGAWILKFLERA